MLTVRALVLLFTLIAASLDGGGAMDPNGVDSGPIMDPNGRSAQSDYTGCVDPNGGCRER